MASQYKLSEETRRKMSETRKRLGIKPPSWLGKTRGPQSLEHRRKLGEAKGGKTHTEEWKQAQSERMMGRKHTLGTNHSEETRRRISLGLGGSGVLNADHRHIRSSHAHKEWARSIYRRDSHTCQMCGLSRGKVEANHIKQFSTHADVRFDPTNGITLCPPCHRSIRGREAEWESYFFFNLATRGFIEDEHLPSNLSEGGVH